MERCRRLVAGEGVETPAAWARPESLTTEAILVVLAHSVFKDRDTDMVPSGFPDLPWQKVAVDLFHCACGRLLLRVSRGHPAYGYESARSHQARQGTPETVFSDNGPWWLCFGNHFAEE